MLWFGVPIGASGLVVEGTAKMYNYITATNAATFNNIHNMGVAGTLVAAVGFSILYINHQSRAIERLDRTFQEKLAYNFSQI
jgi:hypothetical protein